jgi:hypothetical protein
LIAQLVAQPAMAPSQRYGVQVGLPAEPLARRVQAPKLPATLHASQLPPHALLQQ